MTIAEAYQARLDRWNRIWLSATGHTFEDDPKFCKEQEEEERKTWEPKINEVLQKHGFSSLNAYIDQIHWADSGVQEGRIEEIDEIWRKEPKHTSPFAYEIMTMDDAKRTAEFIEGLGGAAWWKENVKGGMDYRTVENLLKAKGYKTAEGHSFNSFTTMLLWAGTLVNHPDLFPYHHGALACLIGDEGYHDDRSDLPDFEKLY